MAATDFTEVLTAERRKVALDAAEELEDIFCALLDCAHQPERSYRSEPIVRALSARGLDVARAAMSALDEGEEVRPTSELREVVQHG